MSNSASNSAPLQVLHIILALTRGGAARVVLATAQYSAQLAGHQHRILSLQPAEPGALVMAQSLGIPVLQTDDVASVMAEVAQADVVTVHFWHSAHLYALLEAEWPPARLVIFCHIGGLYAPQVVTAELVEFADCFVATSPFTYELHVLASLPVERRATKTRMIWGAADFARIENVKPQPHAEFNVGYIGTVSFTKLHADYVALCAQIDLPNVRFPVYGSGNGFPELQRQAKTLGIAERFIWGGYVENVAEAIATFDVFGYPLCADSYASSELILQEVMYMGVPPVLLIPHGRQSLVIHEQTGLVAQTAEEYVNAVKYLYNHPAERQRLGQAAAAYARMHWGAEKSAAQVNSLCAELMQSPKRDRHFEREWASDSVTLSREVASHFPGATTMLRRVAYSAPSLLASLVSVTAEQRLAADEQIAKLSHLLVFSDGGILQYATDYPHDGLLARWAGVALAAKGRPALALAHLRRALALCGEDWTLRWQMAQAAAAANARALAKSEVESVLATAPHFAPAVHFAAQL